MTKLAIYGLNKNEEKETDNSGKELPFIIKDLVFVAGHFNSKVIRGKMKPNTRM